VIYNGLRINKFQFLLVRLKDLRRTNQFLRRVISIPFGAIKRVYRYLHRSSKRLFQFLLVRLKVKEQSTELAVLKKFQFLLVRLKDFLTLFNTKNLQTFQFLLVRLKGRNGHRFSYFDVISIPFGAIKRFLHLQTNRQ